MVIARQVPKDREERRARGPEPVEKDDGRSTPPPRLQIERVHLGGGHPMAPGRARVALHGLQEVVELEGDGDVAAQEKPPLEERLNAREASVQNVGESGRI